MNEVLSQDEIDQLLTAISSGETEQEDFRPVSDTRKIKIYDFKRPDKFSKEQIRTVSIMHETFDFRFYTIFNKVFHSWLGHIRCLGFGLFFWFEAGHKTDFSSL